MPHAGNTYDWRGVVLRRRDRDPATWPAVFSALLEQSYIDEAAVVVVWAVQPDWWAERYRANVAELVDRQLIDPARRRGLLAMVDAGPPGGADRRQPLPPAGHHRLGRLPRRAGRGRLRPPVGRSRWWTGTLLEGLTA